jgi:hypothetical protein
MPGANFDSCGDEDRPHYDVVSRAASKLMSRSQANKSTMYQRKVRLGRGAEKEVGESEKGERKVGQRG